MTTNRPIDSARPGRAAEAPTDPPLAEAAAQPPAPEPGPAGPAPTPLDAAAPPGLLGGVLEGLRHIGRDVFSVTFGKLLESPDALPELPPPEAAPGDQAAWRIRVLHSVAEQLRGAADTYVAAKLDEIEARVDQKLDAIEERIDRKILELHQQLLEMRDRELRHRLRVLKLTLIFTVLVALLSLLYTVAKHLIVRQYS